MDLESEAQNMIKGYDMSHWQSDKDFKKGLKNAQFMILKATEGKSMVDNTLVERMSNVDFQALPHGYYHFAHPELNSFEMELDNFKKAIGEEYYKEDVLLALDWESKALSCTFDWALAFCNQVFADTGKHCLIYASASAVKKYAKLYNYWWVAHYNYDCMDGCTHCGTDNQYIVQFSSRPVDTNALLKPWKFTDDNVTIGDEATRIYPHPKFNRKERYFNENVD